MVRGVLLFLVFFLGVISTSYALGSKSYHEYVKFFDKVYETFDKNYYLEPNRKTYNNFLKKFRTKIYPELSKEGKSDDYVRWRSAWYLVDALKSQEDKFSQFYPPKPAEEFKHEALGERIDLGINGVKVDAGFLVTKIEPRSNAYERGLREDDILLRVNDQELKGLSVEEIDKTLTPLSGSKVPIEYYSKNLKEKLRIQVMCQEYFKQTVFFCPVEVPGIACLEIPKFNRTTGDDLFRFLDLVHTYDVRGLILDLRGNPGGPPLAAREISSFFLKNGEEFAFFQKRGAPKDSLDVPVIPDQYHFKEPIVILVDENSGSASELFAGILQFRGRAEVMGMNTAGQVLLKSMFPLDDGSMVALVTAPGYYPDGSRFSFSGITPNKIIKDASKEGLINLAGIYLIQKAMAKEGQR